MPDTLTLAELQEELTDILVNGALYRRFVTSRMPAILLA
jgi:hypothetical protein